MFTQISVAALFAGLAAAYHAPVGNPSGNPITRPLNEIVPACKPFEITWTPTTSNTVSLVLLKGPSSNVIPVNAIVEGIANSGSFSWTPDASLEATTTPTGYGLEIIDDVTGQYQYSTQFGISKSGCVVSSSSSAAAKPTTPAYSVVPKPSETKTPVPTTTAKPITSAKPVSSSTSICTTTTAYVAISSGFPANGTIIQPTKPITLPSSLKPSATATAGNTTAPVFPGAASGLQAGMGLAGFVAAVVAML